MCLVVLLCLSESAPQPLIFAASIVKSSTIARGIYNLLGIEERSSIFRKINMNVGGTDSN